MAGSYKATGITRDSLGDTGTWSFTLTVVATKLTQVAPTKGATVTAKHFTSHLEISDAHGTVTYAQSTGAPRLKISSSGKVSAPTTLVAGIYKALGAARDTLGDTGAWSFTLTVVATKLTQVAPITGATSAGKVFTGQLEVSSSHGAVTYAQSIGAPRLKISSSGMVSAPATLVPGTYKALGTARDTLGDTGTWSFALKVTAHRIAQVAPITGTTTTGKAFTGQLKFSGSHGTVTCAQSKGAPRLKVSSSGKVSALATLAAGSYKAAGTVKDTFGGTGAWSFALTVKATKLIQAAPATGATTTGKAFTDQLKLSGSHGTVTYAQSTGAPQLKVSSSGKVSAPATLATGTYKATGTAKDTYGDTGTWTFTLVTVKSTKLTQIAPTTGTTTVGKSFTSQLEVSGAYGLVDYTQLTGAQVLTVSASGKVSAPAALLLTAAIYKITGTVRDSVGDTGTWSFTLTVGAAASPHDLQGTAGLQSHSPAGDLPAPVDLVWKPAFDLCLAGT